MAAEVHGGTSRWKRLAPKALSFLVLLVGLLSICAGIVWSRDASLSTARLAVAVGAMLVILSSQIWRGGSDAN